MRDMMQDPEALAELSELMKDPAFKAQVDAFTSNPDVRSRVQQQGAGAFLGGEAKQPSAQMDPRDHAKLKAEADMEYEKYRSQFTGEQNAAKGLEAIVGAAKDPERLADAMRDLNDPEMMKAAHEMMADPSFQAEMQRMMQQPEMRKIVEASSSFVQELQKDPSKMAEMQQRSKTVCVENQVHVQRTGSKYEEHRPSTNPPSNSSAMFHANRRSRATSSLVFATVAIKPSCCACSPPAGRARRCLLYTSPSPRDATLSRMPSSA